MEASLIPFNNSLKSYFSKLRQSKGLSTTGIQILFGIYESHS